MVVFDTRLGLFDEIPPEKPLQFIKAVDDFFTHSQPLEFGAQRFFMHYVETSDWKKMCDAHDTAMAIGQEYVNKKLDELQNMGDDGLGEEYRKRDGKEE